MKILILIDLRKHVSTCFWFYFPYAPEWFLHSWKYRWINMIFFKQSVNCILSHNIGKHVSDRSPSLCFSILIYLDLVCRLSNSRSSPRMKWTGSKKFCSSSEKKEEEVSNRKVMPMKMIYTLKAHCFLDEGLQLWFWRIQKVHWLWDCSVISRSNF